MGFLDLFKKKKKEQESANPQEAAARYIAQVKAEKRDTLTKDQGKELRALYLKVAEEDGQEGALRAASGLMMEKKYRDAQFAYKLIMERFPEVQGLCLSQIGVAHSEMDEPDKALESYLLARKEGAKPAMIDELIWYLCEEQFEATGSAQWLQQYLEHSPEGRYRKEAEALQRA